MLHGVRAHAALPRNRNTAARLEIGICRLLLLLLLLFQSAALHHCCAARPLLLPRHLLFILTCVQASGVLAAPLLFFIQVTGKSAPLVAAIALKPGVSGWVVGVAVLVVLQVHLSCLFRGDEVAEVVVVAG